MDKDLIVRWKEYVENGGNLILTCRTGQKNREAHLWNEKFAEPIYDLIGAKELFFDVLPSSLKAYVQSDKANYEWNNWADVVTPVDKAEVWGIYSDQFYKGKAAVTHMKHRKGSVTFIGTDTNDGKLEKSILNKVYSTRGVQIEDLPEGVVLIWKYGFWVGLNYTSETFTFHIPENSKIIIGEKNVVPAGVVVWQ